MQRFMLLTLAVACESISVGRRALLRAGVSSVVAAPAATRAYDDATFKSVATQVGGDDYTSLPGGLKYKEVRPGKSSEQAAVGDTVFVQLSGRCLNLNGKKFISTQVHGCPLRAIVDALLERC
jgi:FKBP-type peptidyl-prolyl cis-trans isomerase